MVILKVPAPDPPHCVIEAFVDVRDKELGYPDDTIEERKRQARDQYVLKVCGREEYMLTECCLHTYQVGLHY